MKRFWFKLWMALALAVAATFSLASGLPALGAVAPEFGLPDQGGKIHSMAQYRGKWLVLYFYPKDETPGCTEQACKFRDDFALLKALGAEVIGVSVDDASSHAEFARKYKLPFPLLADKDGRVADSYGSLRDFLVTKIAKRNTFLINPQGRIEKIYLGVDSGKNSSDVIADLRRLSGGQQR